MRKLAEATKPPLVFFTAYLINKLTLHMDFWAENQMSS